MLAMPSRQKFQSPKVKAAGKMWKCRYRLYFIGTDGDEHHKAQSATWDRATHTKADAQAKCNALMLELTQGGPKADGSMTLGQFWDAVYLPIRRRKWTGSTLPIVTNTYKNHILPTFGKMPLKDITKAAVEIHLGRLVDAGKGKSTVQAVLVRLHSILEEALDNDYIPKNPCRKVEVPANLTRVESKSLTEAEVQALWDGTTGMDYLFWRILILTGARIGEVLALVRSDLRPDGLLIDEAMVRGTIKAPKRGKVRLAALPESLRAELVEWCGDRMGLIFPAQNGGCHTRQHDKIQEIVDRGRAIVPGVSFRQCRTTFASLFDGDAADRTSIMGHHSEAFTLTQYRKPIQERRQRAVEAMDERLRNVVQMRKKGA